MAFIQKLLSMIYSYSFYPFIIRIFEQYKPHLKRESCDAYASTYMRYIEHLKPNSRGGQNKGRVVGKFRNNNIYEYPLQEVKDALLQVKTWSDIRDKIMQKYFPNYSTISLNSITTTYKLYAEGRRDNGLRR